MSVRSPPPIWITNVAIDSCILVPVILSIILLFFYLNRPIQHNQCVSNQIEKVQFQAQVCPPSPSPSPHRYIYVILFMTGYPLFLVKKLIGYARPQIVHNPTYTQIDHCKDYTYVHGHYVNRNATTFYRHGHWRRLFN